MQQYYLKGMILGFLAVLLSSCGSYQYQLAKLSYNIECINCSSQKNHMIDVEFSSTIDENNPIIITLVNKLEESIIVDKIMSTMTEDGNVIYQPIFLENPNFTTTSGSSYSSKRNVEVPGLYNPIYELNYNQSESASYSSIYEINYKPPTNIFLPPLAKVTMSIYDLIALRAKKYTNYREIYFESDEAIYNFKNKRDNFFKQLIDGSYSFFIYTKRIEEDKWTQNEFKIRFKNIKIK